MRTVDEILASWSTRSGSAEAQNKYKQSVNGVKENPLEQAASDEASRRYLDGVQKSEASGLRKAKLRAYPFNLWKQVTAEKGAARLRDGTANEAAKQRYRAALQKFTPVYQSIKDEARLMPKGSVSEAMAIVEMAYRKLKEAAGKPIM